MLYQVRKHKFLGINIIITKEKRLKYICRKIWRKQLNYLENKLISDIYFGSKRTYETIRWRENDIFNSVMAELIFLAKIVISDIEMAVS